MTNLSQVRPWMFVSCAAKVRIATRGQLGWSGGRKEQGAHGLWSLPAWDHTLSSVSLSGASPQRGAQRGNLDLAPAMQMHSYPLVTKWFLHRLRAAGAKKTMFAENILSNKTNKLSYARLWLLVKPSTSAHISAKVCLENCYIWTWFQFIWACRWRHLHICTVLGKQALNRVMNGCQGDLAKDAEASDPFHWEVPMFYQCLPLFASLVWVVILKLPQCCHALQGLPSAILGPPLLSMKYCTPELLYYLTEFVVATVQFTD